MKKIGIMGAMPQEVMSLSSLLQNIRTETSANREYIIGEFLGMEVVLVFSQCGKVAAATTATTLILKYEIDCLIFTGVAGAAAKQLEIGDIVMGEILYQHDMDASPMFPKYQVPLTNKIFFEADKDLTRYLHQAAIDFLRNLTAHISPKILANYQITSPKIYKGKIASGDQFITCVEKSNLLINDMPDLLAFEMEGSAVAQVCVDEGIPFAVIRNISDKADRNAAIDFMKYIDEISVHYANGIVKNMLQYLADSV